MSFEICFSVWQGCASFYPLHLRYQLHYLQDYSENQVEISAQVFDLAYADGIMLNMNDHKEVQNLLEAVNHHAIAAGIRINASKAKVMSALIPNEQLQVVASDGESL